MPIIDIRALAAGTSRVYAHWFCVLGSVADAFARVAAVQIDLMTGASSWEDAADLARKLEGAGFGGMLYTETTQVPWMQIAAASMARRACSSQPASPWRFRVARCSLLRWRTGSPPTPGSLPTWSGFPGQGAR